LANLWFYWQHSQRYKACTWQWFSSYWIKKLNNGASDRASLVEKLEMAFKTPAKIDLCYDFADLRAEVSALPPRPMAPGTQVEITSDISLLGIEYPSQSQLLEFDLPSDIQKPGAIKPVSDPPHLIKLAPATLTSNQTSWPVQLVLLRQAGNSTGPSSLAVD
jgi:hypothetical protein